MSFIATVENDTIKLPPGVHLPDGTKVSIEPAKEPGSAALAQPTLYESLRDFVGCIDTGLGDVAENHDHYAHRAPKGIDRL